MKRGPYKIKDKSIYNRALELRAQGYGYRYISKQVEISHDTIKYWVKDIKVDARDAHHKFSLSITATSTDNLVSKSAVRACLLRKRGRKCECCELTEWLEKPITIEINHIDGDSKNNVEGNLELLCPNCHSYTPTWRRQKSSLVVELADTADLGSVN